MSIRNSIFNFFFVYFSNLLLSYTPQKVFVEMYIEYINKCLVN